ncbi:type VII secretion target [Williamsia sp. D3]|uniref:type VII secretion target n=1 Tax=Williamsia sp. D3 TaxID=1313067 RepID=UPI0003D2DF48|nr:type VII secretion target [Williamsia sp. D3]ETD30728.1 hypothetical protein W823_23395 [Williamsia sp. D3]
MSQVSVDPAALRTASLGTRSVGEDIATQALAGRADAALLAPVFGVIGAEFAAAAAMVTDRHCREIEQLAARVRTLGDGLRGAQVAYAGTDDNSAAQIAAI